MDTIITLEGDAIWALSRVFGVSEADRTVYRLRVARDGDSVKIKVNEGTWSPPFPLAAEDRLRRANEPYLTDEQVEILRKTISLEGPHAAGKISEEKYNEAYEAARAANLDEVLEMTAQFFTRYHYSAEEISATAATAQTMRDIIESVYANR